LIQSIDYFSNQIKKNDLNLNSDEELKKSKELNPFEGHFSLKAIAFQVEKVKNVENIIT
jgi:hypothetical protein